MNIFAHTAPEGTYPSFVSVNRNAAGDVEVTVRSAPTLDEDKQYLVPGATAVHVVPAADWSNLCAD